MNIHRAILLIAVSLPVIATTIEAAEPAKLTVVGRDGERVELSAEELQAMPRTELEINDRDGTPAKFAGVEVTHLLSRVGAAQGQDLRGKWMRCFVMVNAKDDYCAVFGLAEFDPAFTDRKIVLVDTRNGEPLAENNGPFQIIVPGEKKHARWVRMVTEIKVADSHD